MTNRIAFRSPSCLHGLPDGVVTPSMPSLVRNFHPGSVIAAPLMVSAFVQTLVSTAAVQAAQQDAVARPAVDKPRTFDVASVKPAAGTRGESRTTIDPGRIHYPAIALKGLLINAYDVRDFQIVGPGWLSTETFQVDATMPPDTTKAQLREMFQNLLAERFKLTLHHETKELPIYGLVVSKNGPKFRESAADPAPKDNGMSAPKLSEKQKGEPDTDADGFPSLPMPTAGSGGIVSVSLATLGSRIRAHQVTMQDFVNELMRRQLLGRPVKDETALHAKYDFVLTFSPMGLNHQNGPIGGDGNARSSANPTDVGASLPDLFQAVQLQLGLKLEPMNGPVELIVIDHIERVPSGN